MKIVNVSLKREGTGKNGRPYKIFEVEDESGKKYDTFDTFAINEEVEVTITANTNPAYNSSIKRLKAQGSTQSGQEGKWSKVMDRKEDSINWAGAKRDAVAITVALINAKFIIDPKVIKPTIEYYCKYIYNLTPETNSQTPPSEIS